MIPWKDIYDHARKQICVTVPLYGEPYELVEGEDYEITDHYHSDTTLWLELRYIGNYTGSATVGFCVGFDPDGGWYIDYTDDPPPDGIRIGDRLYTTTRGTAEQAHGKLEAGSCRNAKQEIFVADGLSPELEAETWIHEITHAVLGTYRDELSTGWSKGQEERFVKSFAKLAAETIRRNPQYFGRREKQ